MAKRVKRLLLFGPPGAGKGTQAAIVARQLGIPHIDTGSIIRDNIRDKTPLGVEAKAFVAKGELVTDDLVIRLVADRLKKADAADGWLLDGFPRSLAQATALSNMGEHGEEMVDKVVFIDVPEEPLVKRLTSRRICVSCKGVYNLETLPPSVHDVCDACGGELVQRTDDNEESVRTRFHVYHEETAPIADYYRGKGLLIKVDGMGEIEEITDRIMRALNEE
jgi:adenylate kinase